MVRSGGRLVPGRGIPIITIRHPEAPRRDGFLEEHQDLVLPTSAGPRSGEYLVAQKVLEILVRDPRTNAVGVRALRRRSLTLARTMPLAVGTVS
jgi:hypothetical protein